LGWGHRAAVTPGEAESGYFFFAAFFFAPFAAFFAI
jgi:hypothetical protein